LGAKTMGGSKLVVTTGRRRGIPIGISFMLAAGFFCLANAGSATAQDKKNAPPADPTFASNVFNEIETENLFGFTQGSDIGQPGEKEIGWESVGSFGKRDGKYRAVEHKLEFGYNPT